MEPCSNSHAMYHIYPPLSCPLHLHLPYKCKCKCKCTRPKKKQNKKTTTPPPASLSSVLLGTRTCSLQCGMWAGRPRSDHSGGTTLRTQTDSYTWWIRTTENEPRRQRKSCNGFASKMNSGTALCKFFYATTQGRGIFILTKTYSLRLDSIRLDDIAWV